MIAARAIEFRIPISPTRAFFHQVRFFDFALRRLGGHNADAALRVVVGDNTDHDAILRENAWSVGRNIIWECVPSAIFDRYGIHGTADYRYVPEPNADLTILSDADTVLARDIDPLLDLVDASSATVAGHMAHFPAPAPDGLAHITPDQVWPFLLECFALELPSQLHRYSMDVDRALALAPPYFNLGFIALTRRALEDFRGDIWATQDRLLEVFPSHMRCQLAVTLIALRAGHTITPLPAAYNFANDQRHLAASGLSAADARVIHYLRADELKREEMVLPEYLPAVLAQRLENPLNRRLQELLRDYAAQEFGIV